MVAEEFQLGLEDILDGPLDDGLTDLDGEGLDGIVVEIEPWALLTIGPPGDDFTPAIGHVAEFGEIVGLTLGERHVEFVLELEERGNLGKSA
jgi:hypothetical protein